MYSMVKTRNKRYGKSKRYRKYKQNNFVGQASNATKKFSSVAKRANTDLKYGIGAVEGEVGSVARGAQRGAEYGIGAVEYGVRGAERGAEYGVGAVSKGVGAVTSEVGSVARGAEREIENLTHMFTNKHNIKGGRRTRSKRRRRSTKKR